MEHHTDEPKDAGLIAAASDLMRALESKDVKGIKDALRAAFMILESEPHDEAPEEG